MKKVFTTDELDSNYRRFGMTESMEAGGPIVVKADCGCAGQMVPGNNFEMELCPTHEQEHSDQ
jgi:hypothetical protein